MRKLLSAFSSQLIAYRRFPRHAAIELITLYQRTLSPDHGPLKVLYPYGFCRHTPTCSEYGKQMIAALGTFRGSLLLFKRLLSCHPWKKLSEERMREIVLR